MYVEGLYPSRNQRRQDEVSSSLLFNNHQLNVRLREHSEIHRRCRKEDCEWNEAQNQKDMDRHVWRHHKVWAESTGYAPMNACCSECSSVFARADGLSRHKKEVHGAMKRVRKSGG